jgi:CBS domain-containing protein
MSLVAIGSAFCHALDFSLFPFYFASGSARNGRGDSPSLRGFSLPDDVCLSLHKEEIVINVRQLLQSKGQTVWSTAPGTSVFDALQLMAGKNIGALMVVDGERLAGVFSERDYARKVILKGKTSHQLAVSEVMTTSVVSVRPDQTIIDCMELMTNMHVRHLPVLDAGRLVGVISIGDVVKSIISDQKEMIDHLEGYITGRR